MVGVAEGSRQRSAAVGLRAGYLARRAVGPAERRSGRIMHGLPDSASNWPAGSLIQAIRRLSRRSSPSKPLVCCTPKGGFRPLWRLSRGTIQKKGRCSSAARLGKGPQAVRLRPDRGARTGTFSSGSLTTSPETRVRAGVRARRVPLCFFFFSFVFSKPAFRV